MNELVSTAYEFRDGCYFPKQLYCTCGGELHGISSDGYIVLECQKCKERIAGTEAECLIEAFMNDLI